MMTRTMRVTLELEVSDLPHVELKENAKLAGCTVQDLVRVADVESHDVADCLTDTLENSEEIFSGSDMHIQLKGAKIISSAWV